jgi:peptide deformylase
VKRRLNTVARGFTDRGDPVQVVGTEVIARCLQHETEHLRGKFRASKWHMQMKMSRHRKTGRIL